MPGALGEILGIGFRVESMPLPSGVNSRHFSKAIKPLFIQNLPLVKEAKYQ
jgi:hypothetical protein